MKLEQCLEIGHECGLQTIKECYNNIEFHATSIFKYTQIGRELLELQKDIFYHSPDEFCNIFSCSKETLLNFGWKIKED